MEWLLGAFHEARNGTPDQASEYCKRYGQFVETGEKTHAGKRTDMQDRKKMVIAKRPFSEICDATTCCQQLKDAELYKRCKDTSRPMQDIEDSSR